MRVVVTGCTGFIGSHLTPALAGAGYGVSGIVEPGSAGGLGDFPSHIVDICGGDGLAAAFIRADVVIHLAARSHVLRERSMLAVRMGGSLSEDFRKIHPSMNDGGGRQCFKIPSKGSDK